MPTRRRALFILAALAALAVASLALALMVAGLPLYFFLRHLRNRTTRHA